MNNRLLYLTMLTFSMALTVAADLAPRQEVAGNTVTAATSSSAYFPQGTTDPFADFYSTYLNYIGEPSLLAGARDANVTSYRLICIGCQSPNLLVLRISVRSDGNAAVSSTLATVDGSGKPTVGGRSERSASAADLNHFLRCVERAGFWSMPTTLQEKNKTANMDGAASRWVFEGATKGNYHVVFREGPQEGPVTEMARVLAKDLAKLDDAAVPRAIPSQPPIAIKTIKTP
jgi:hypothetical protein